MSSECKCNMSYHGVPFHWDDCPEAHPRLVELAEAQRDLNEVRALQREILRKYTRLPGEPVMPDDAREN